MGYIIKSFYKIGSSHIVCEDYAFHEKNLAALSDGCSSSIDTDIGARLLVRNFIKDPFLDLRDFIKICTLQSLAICNHFHSLDATLGTIIVKDNNCYVRLIGDGLVLTVNSKNEFEYYIIDYEHNAPVYLNYILNSGLIQYKEKFRSWQCSLIYCHSSKMEEIPSIIENDKELKIPIFQKTFNLSEYKKVFLFSDGITSFIKNNFVINLHEIIISIVKYGTDSLFNFSSLKHYDDISCIEVISE